ncbi:MAG: DUF695 domain-containing protein [Kofleriaceae bacterium]
MSVDDGIRDFWTWWSTARDQLLRAIEVDHNFSDSLVQDITRRVRAIGDLDWELSPGKTATHAFCLSPRGNPEARLVTELWRHRGPSPDATWEYFAARQGVQVSKLTFGNVELDRDELMVSFEVDAGRERIDAIYYHPRFAELPEQRRTSALYILLDGALGEDAVERWLGRIEASPKSLASAVSFGQFRDALGQLERTATGDSFVVMQGTNDEGVRIVVTCNRSLKRIDHLLLTMHVAVDLAILDQTPDGMPTNAEAEVLNQLEDELIGALGGLAVYFGRVTTPGHRALHYYAAEDTGAKPLIERWAARHPERQPHVEWTRDPTWEFVKRFV